MMGSKIYKPRKYLVSSLLSLNPLRIQFLRYCVVGAINTTIALAISFILLLAGVNIYSANLLGYIVAIANSFVMNRKWTFGHHGKIRESLPKFLSICLISYALQLFALWGLINYFSINQFVGQLLAMMLYTLASFYANKMIAFTSMNSHSLKQ